MAKHLSAQSRAALVAFLAGSFAVNAPLHAQSGYGGVVPGSDVIPETVTVKPGEDPVATWPGFQMLPDGSSRVFVQTTVPVKPELKRDGTGWLVVLPGVVLAAGNARLPLDTQYFNTPVTSARAKELTPAGVGVHLAMRVRVEPKLRTEEAKNGYFFVFIEFPPGNYRDAQVSEAAPKADEAPAPKAKKKHAAPVKP